MTKKILLLASDEWPRMAGAWEEAWEVKEAGEERQLMSLLNERRRKQI